MKKIVKLSFIFAATIFSDLGSKGITPAIIHSVGVTIDGQSFLGTGKSKKEARKRVAAEILKKFYNWEGDCE
jgi:hypothetical protein